VGWSPKEKWQITKIFVEVFLSGGLLVYRGEFPLIPTTTAAPAATAKTALNPGRAVVLTGIA